MSIFLCIRGVWLYLCDMQRIIVKDKNGKTRTVTVPSYHHDIAWDSGGGGGLNYLTGSIATIYTTPDLNFALTETDMNNFILSGSLSGSFAVNSLNGFTLSKNYYVAVIEGYFNIASSGTYYFSLDSDDASDLYVNNNYIAHWYGGHGSIGAGGHDVTGSISLNAGYIPFKARLQQRTGGDGLTVYYRTNPSDSWVVVPNSWLSRI